MATAGEEVRQSPENDVFYNSDTDSETVIEDLEEDLEVASDFLIYRDFDQCLSHCLQTINRIQATSYHKYVDSFCVVMIQAMAEMDRWDSVLPLVQDIYGKIEHCPVKIIQMCLLLHVKVKEYIRCHTLARLWLQSDHNQHHKGYSDVAKLYVNQVLVPLGALNLIPQFVESCVGLSDEDKNDLLSPVVSPRSEKLSTTRQTTLSESEKSEKSHSDEVEQEGWLGGFALFQSLRGVCRRVLMFIGRFRMTPVFKMCFLMTLAALALVNSLNSDMMTGYGRLMTMWSSFSKLWPLAVPEKPK